VGIALEIWALTWKYADQLAKQGEYVPDLAFAGGITSRTRSSRPILRRGPTSSSSDGPLALAAAMVGKKIGGRINDGQIPVYVREIRSLAGRRSSSPPRVKHRYGERFNDLPAGAIRRYTYFERLNRGSVR